jgi:hypothetical protein
MMNHSSIALHWGSTSDERALPFPCDRYLSEIDSAYFRAVDVRAPAATLFRWLCQLRAAPYSYDWLDNGGRRSPRRLTAGLDELAPGQPVMSIFELVEFERDRHLTLVMVKPRAVGLFGQIACSYMIVPQSEQRCRLLVKLLVRYPRQGRWAAMRWLLPWGDLIMMRKQLLTLARLAERSARTS